MQDFKKIERYEDIEVNAKKELEDAKISEKMSRQIELYYEQLLDEENTFLRDHQYMKDPIEEGMK